MFQRLVQALGPEFPTTDLRVRWWGPWALSQDRRSQALSITRGSLLSSQEVEAALMAKAWGSFPQPLFRKLSALI